MKGLALIFSMLLAFAFAFAFAFFLRAEILDYSIENGRFITSEGAIPNGCFGQLATEFNGDNSVAAVFVNRNSLRGCIDANFPYPGGNEDAVSYEISKSLGNHRYNLLVCESIPEGSLGKNCDRISVSFVNRTYEMPNKSLVVLALEKVGEW